jgi:hypothetical protein
MENQKFNEYVEAVGVYFKENSPHCRYGQACFNVLTEMYPEMSESIRASIIDPFYRETTDVGDFFLFVQENI